MSKHSRAHFLGFALACIGTCIRTGFAHAHFPGFMHAMTCFLDGMTCVELERRLAGIRRPPSTSTQAFGVARGKREPSTSTQAFSRAELISPERGRRRPYPSRYP